MKYFLSYSRISGLLESTTITPPACDMVSDIDAFVKCVNQNESASIDIKTALIQLESIWDYLPLYSSKSVLNQIYLVLVHFENKQTALIKLRSALIDAKLWAAIDAIAEQIND